MSKRTSRCDSLILCVALVECSIRKLYTKRKFSTQKERTRFESDSRRKRYVVVLNDAPAPPRTTTPAESVDIAVFEYGSRTPAMVFPPITGDVFEPSVPAKTVATHYDAIACAPLEFEECIRASS